MNGRILKINGHCARTGYWQDSDLTYYIRSSVLGGAVISETTAAGGKKKTNVYAAGRLSYKLDTPDPDDVEDRMWRHYDGDGRELRRTTERCEIIEPEDETCTWMGEESEYYIRSTVLRGETVSEAGAGGSKIKRMVLVGGQVVAYLTHRYEYSPSGTYDAVHFRHYDAVGASERVTRAYPENLLGTSLGTYPLVDPNYIDNRHAEYDPAGGNVGLKTSYEPQYGHSNTDFRPIDDDSYLMIDGQRVQATVDGVAMSWNVIRMMADAGALAVPMHDAQERATEPSEVHNNLGNLSWNSSFTFRFRSTFDPTTESYSSILTSFSYDISSFDTSQTIDDASEVKVPLPADFRQLIEARLNKNNGDCNSFLARLFKKASEFTILASGEVVKRNPAEISGAITGLYAVDGFELLKKIKGFETVDNLPVSGTVTGSIPNNNATVQLRTKTFNPIGLYKGWSRDAMRANQVAYVIHAIHEMAHLAGAEFAKGDFILALAGKEMGETDHSISSNIKTGQRQASVAVSNIINNHCGE